MNGPLCLIPARGGSRRFPRKNLAFLAGKPLLAHAVAAARASGVFSLICVSSEDGEILAAAREAGADAALPRPPELAGDTAMVKEVCIQVLEHFSARGQAFREFGVLLPTTPLRRPEDLQAGYRLLQNPEVNYVMSLVPFSHPPQRAVWAPEGYVEPYFGLQFMRPAQQLDPLYRHDGSFIFAKTEVFLREREFYGTRVAPYFIPPEYSVDIDSPLDLAWAEFLLARRREGGAP
jgi:CMP-N-acetylneuraminic acid synthetase